MKWFKKYFANRKELNILGNLIQRQQEELSKLRNEFKQAKEKLQFVEAKTLTNALSITRMDQQIFNILDQVLLADPNFMAQHERIGNE